MPVPDPDTWRARWASADQHRLGVHAGVVADGFASFVIDLPYGDERDSDPLFASAALTYAADVAALSAVLARLDEEREQPNGTASLHLNFVRPPSGTVTIEARVSAWGVQDALVECSGRDGEGQLVMQGLVTYSLRARTAGVRV